MLKENGHDTKLIYFTRKGDFRKAQEAVYAYNPDVVCISALSSTFGFVDKIGEVIKKAKKVPILCGGIHTTLLPESLERLDYIDGVVAGEGEYPILEFIEHNGDTGQIRNLWLKTKSATIKNDIRPPVNLDDLPNPDREIFDFQGIINAEKFAPFIFTRGCPFNCAYCCNSSLNRIYHNNYFRCKDARKCIGEIIEVKKKYKFGKIAFYDDIFNIDVEWSNLFLEFYKKQVNLPFGCNLRPEFVDAGLLGKLKDSGCVEVAMGIESGNEYIRNNIMKRRVSNEQIKNAFYLAQKMGFRTIAYNMIGLPYETPAHIKDTIKLNTAIQPDIAHLSIFYPYPGTELGEVCAENKWIGKSYKYFQEREDSILETPIIKGRDMLYFYRNFHYLVFRHKALTIAMYFKLYGFYKLYRNLFLKNIYSRI